ncbi:MAG: transcriptional regulator [Alphaproteobacteria bacterium]|nr:transcriptional regulator [Alphaproteobacteria bacterium]
MSKAGSRVLRSVRKARAFARGEESEGFIVHMPDEVDVRAIRKRLALTRIEFANRFGFSPDAVKEWEIGRRTPDRSARVLLRIVELEPEAVIRALAS